MKLSPTLAGKAISEEEIIGTVAWLTGAFPWQNTEQGFDYWCELAKELRALVPPNFPEKNQIFQAETRTKEDKGNILDEEILVMPSGLEISEASVKALLATLYPCPAQAVEVACAKAAALMEE